MLSKFDNSKLIILCILSTIIALLYILFAAYSLFNFQSPVVPHNQSFESTIIQPITSKVVFVLVDGLRVDTSLDSEIMPYLNNLRSRGAWGVMHSREPSYSQPAYSTLLTGAWPGINGGPLLNLPYESIPTLQHESIISTIQSASLTAAISGYYWFEKLIPQGQLNASFFTPDDDSYADEAVVEAALTWLISSQYQFVLIHLDQLDHAGHNYPGIHSPEWEAAARRIDNHLLEIVSAMDFSQDTLVVTSDHGHIDRGGHGGDELVVLTQPYLFAGAGIVTDKHNDIRMVDIAPTISVLLGVRIPSSSQGYPLTELLLFADSDKLLLKKSSEEQQRGFYNRYAQAFGYQTLEGPTEIELDTYKNAIDTIKLNSVRAGRWVRAPVSLALLFISLIWIWKRRDPHLPWIVGFCLLYHIIFNFLYAFVLNHVYTFSAINDPLKFISALATATGLSFLLCWLILYTYGRIYLDKPPVSRNNILKFSLFIIYTLFIPLLWNYWLNGLLVSMTIPEFSAIFIAILSSFQLLFISIVSLILVHLSGNFHVNYARRNKTNF